MVAVLGLGMLGLTACAWLDTLGATVIACDASTTRLYQAARFGARHLAKPDDLVEVAASLTHGRGADAAFELSGSSRAATAALGVVRTGGTVVWAGTVAPTVSVAVDPEMVVRRCLKIVGVHNYAPPDLAAAIEFLAARHTRYPFAELVANTFPLDEVDAAFHFASAKHPIRVAIACH
jgi:alcohol dehydrogenase